jgi:hypothetical protein
MPELARKATRLALRLIGALRSKLLVIEMKKMTRENTAD